jgi:hypothetical protein
MSGWGCRDVSGCNDCWIFPNGVDGIFPGYVRYKVSGHFFHPTWSIMHFFISEMDSILDHKSDLVSFVIQTRTRKS